MINQNASLIVQKRGPRRYEFHLSRQGLSDMHAALRVAAKFGQTSGSCLTDEQNDRIANLLAVIDEYLREVSK